MSYSVNGVGSYYLNGLGADAGCDVAQDFDPVQVAAWITKAGSCWRAKDDTRPPCTPTQQAEANSAGKKYTYWVVAALWRLGYTTAGFDMSITPAGYVNWGDAQAAAIRAWRKNRTGTAGAFFPAAGEMQALKDDLLANRITGPNPPKIVCISGTTAADITPTAAPACPPGWTGTPPNCTPPAAPTPAACIPAQTPSFQGAQFSDADWQLRLALYNRATKKLGNYGADGSKVVTGTWGPADDQAMAAFVAAEGLSSQADASGAIDPQIRYARLAEKTPGACDAATVEATVKAINGTAKPVVSGKCPTGYKLVGTKCVKVPPPPPKPSYAGYVLGAAALVGIGALVWMNRDKAKAAAAPKVAAAKVGIRRAGGAAKRKILAVVPKGMRVREVALKANRRRRRRAR